VPMKLAATTCRTDRVRPCRKTPKHADPATSR
jgi:hypothetical protein